MALLSPSSTYRAVSPEPKSAHGGRLANMAPMVNAPAPITSTSGSSISEDSMPTHITRHAIDRYRERVEFVSDEAIRERLSTPSIRAAIRFGVRVIRLGSGAKLVVTDGKIVTVLAPHQRPKRYKNIKRPNQRKKSNRQCRHRENRDAD